jgi:hypothetical protein
MKLRMKVRAGGIYLNHNAAKSLKIRTKARAGGVFLNHNAVR